MSEGPIERFTAEELRRKHAQGESRSDLPRVRAMSDEQVEEVAAADLREHDLPPDWHLRARVETPKIPISIRVDADVLEFFRGQGAGWQTRMNAALRAYADAVRKAG